MAGPIGKTPRRGIGTNVPLEICQRIDEIARQRGVSRSAVVSEALGAYVARADAAKRREEKTGT
jgi:metal-responsive CopG/Arc/MetJ family transcriptional regulator